MLLFYCGCAWAADAVEMMLLSFLGTSSELLTWMNQPLTYLDGPCTWMHARYYCTATNY